MSIDKNIKKNVLYGDVLDDLPDKNDKNSYMKLRKILLKNQ